MVVAELVSGGFYTVGEAADELRMSRAMIYKLMTLGKLPYTQIARCRRIPKKAIADLAAAGMVGADDATGEGR